MLVCKHDVQLGVLSAFQYIGGVARVEGNQGQGVDDDVVEPDARVDVDNGKVSLGGVAHVPGGLLHDPRGKTNGVCVSGGGGQKQLNAHPIGVLPRIADPARAHEAAENRAARAVEVKRGETGTGRVEPIGAHMGDDAIIGVLADARFRAGVLKSDVAAVAGEVEGNGGGVADREVERSFGKSWESGQAERFPVAGQVFEVSFFTLVEMKVVDNA